MIDTTTLETSYYLLPIVGFIIAIVGTMIGGGGGFFFFPILTVIYKLPAPTAVATSLLSTIPICLAGTFSYYRKRLVNFKAGGLLSIMGIAGAFIGTFITKVISPQSLKTTFGIYSIFMAMHLIRKAYRETIIKSIDLEHHHQCKIAVTSAWGISAGIITGSFGTSGSAPILTALFGLNLPIKQIIGTSLLVVLINTIVASSVHLIVTDISTQILLLISIGSVPGALLGPRLFSKAKIKDTAHTFKYIYAIIIAIIGTIMIVK